MKKTSLPPHLALLLCSLTPFTSSATTEAQLLERLTILEHRVTTLEQQLGTQSTPSRWKNQDLWFSIQKEMSKKAVDSLLGKPGRIEENIFTTWYYHPTSKLHSFVWFDEGVVLGWTGPE